MNYLTWFTASNIWVTSMVWYTCAIASVITSITNSILSTVTGVYTFLIATSKNNWAFWICQTLIGLAFYVRTTFGLRGTLTSCFVHIYCAESVDATLFKWTWVLTFSLNTSFVK